MELMAQSGLTPMQVIQAFSKGSSEAMGIDKDYGTLARGKVADLLVLEKNPLDNIANMRTIETIYLAGRNSIVNTNGFRFGRNDKQGAGALWMWFVSPDSAARGTLMFGIIALQLALIPFKARAK